MQLLTIAGNVGKDAQLRDAAGDKVLNFSLAVDNGKDKNGNKRDATWFDCAIWGKRAESLERHITKGTKLCLTGRPGARAHDGKAYLQITVQDLTFMGSAQQGGDRQDRSGYDQSPASGGGYGSGGMAKSDLDDEIPF